MNIRNLFKSPKPAWASVCSEVYKDKQGRRYYKYNDELDMSIMRKGEIDKRIMELRYGTDFNDVLEAMKSGLNEFDKKGKAKPNIQNIGYYIQELLDREQLLLLPDTLMRICANTVMREDESAAIPDMEILEEKVQTFKNELQRGGLFSFFHSVGLLKLLGLSGISMTDFNRLITDSECRLKEFHNHLYISVQA